jgi:hypothetical protein
MFTVISLVTSVPKRHAVATRASKVSFPHLDL